MIRFLSSRPGACDTIGYHNVRDYPGGKQDWIQAGLPHEGNHHDKEQN